MTNTPTKKKSSTVLPRGTVDYLKNWMMSPEHIAHPYPTEKEKAEIMAATDIELKQLTNWFVNNRKRFWKPRVEARLQQQLQAQTTAVSMASQSQSIERAVFQTQLASIPLAFNRPSVNVTIPSIQTRVADPDQTSFQIITNRHTFVRPNSGDFSLHNNSQVVSMGSSSCSLDTDSTSISNCSNDGNDIFCTNEDTFESSQRANSPTRKEVIVETAIAHTLNVDIVIDTDRQVVSPCRDPIQSSSKSMKRSRSKSDLLSYASARKIIACPRSLSFAESRISSVEPARERKYVQNWQSACSNARHGYDNSLPSMEEAANLFGFSGI